jgi:hypothetical protein
MIVPVQKFIRHLRIIGGHLVVVFGIKLESLRKLYYGMKAAISDGLWRMGIKSFAHLETSIGRLSEING